MWKPRAGFTSRQSAVLLLQYETLEPLKGAAILFRAYLNAGC